MEAYMKSIEDSALMNITSVVAEPIGIGYGNIDGGKLSSESAQKLAENVTEHMVNVDPLAPSTCIDGRPCVELMNGSATGPRASVAGGGLLTAFAAAELAGWLENDDSKTSARLRNVSEYLQALGFAFGAHCDQRAVENDFIARDADGNATVNDSGDTLAATGCGADDKLVQILEQPYAHSAEVFNLTAAILGEDFDAGFTKFVSGEVVARRMADWNPKDLIDSVGGESSGNIEILSGQHAELAVVFNLVENTTLDRDAFVRDTGKQVFVVDMWYLDKLAKAMARGPEMVNQQKLLKHAMVAYQVGTYLTLCNGSQRPIFLK